MKISLKKISFLSNLGGNENLGFGGKMEERVFPPSHSIPFYLNSQTKEWSSIHIHSLLLNIPNKGNEKIFLKYPIHSIPFHSFLLSQRKC